jgi:hypothetical protein
VIPYAKRWHAAAAGLTAGLLIAGLAGCSNSNQKSAPAVDCEKPGSCVALARMAVIQMPDGFRNVMVGCWGTTLVSVTSRGAWPNSIDGIASLPSSVSLSAGDAYCAGVPTPGVPK